MTHHFCPFCEKPLKRIKGVTFTEGFRLTDSELKECQQKGIRWDCESCNVAFLFFSKKRAYYWDKNTINDGFNRGWLILTEKIILQHIAPIKVSFS